MSEALNTGVIGLGAMGMPMALNLHQAGLLKSVWNRTLARAQELSQQTGVAIAASPAELASQCDVILLSVSADDDLREVIGMLQPGLREGTVVIDTSTVSTQTARDCHQQLADSGVAFLDAPVSGGVEGARKGTLTMMVGGDQQALDKARPVLDVVAGKVIYMGGSGNGQATKAVNQVMAAGINQAVTEALAFAGALNLDMDKVIEVVGSGAAGNWFVQHRGASMHRGEFPPGFKVALHHKDLLLCQAMIDTLSDADKKLPLVEMTLLHYQRLIDAGFADEDISALYRLKKELFTEND